MKVVLSNKFNKDFKRIRDKKLLDGILIVIKNLEQAKDIKDIVGIKKLKGVKKDTYRIKRKELKQHRIALRHKDNTVILELIRVLHRKDIYKKI